MSVRLHEIVDAGSALVLLSVERAIQKHERLWRETNILALERVAALQDEATGGFYNSLRHTFYAMTRRAELFAKEQRAPTLPVVDWKPPFHSSVKTKAVDAGKLLDRIARVDKKAHVDLGAIS